MKKLKNAVGIIAAGLMLAGCSLNIYTSGSMVMLKGSPPTIEQPQTDHIEILLSPPEQAYEVIALVNASADLMDYSFIAEYEAAVIEELRKQAALAGADALLNITREIVRGDVLVTTDSYGDYWLNQYVEDGKLIHPGFARPHATHSTKVSRSFTIFMRAQAIRR